MAIQHALPDDHCVWMLLAGLFETALLTNEIAEIDLVNDLYKFAYDVEQDVEFLEIMREEMYEIEIEMWGGWPKDE